VQHEEPAAEVQRLRAILERQPSCLLRVGIDGTLCAVSDAALGLLGARELSAVLNTNLRDRIVTDAEHLWSEFVLRVSQSGSGSMECEMTDLAGASRSVIIHGVAAPSHPDNIKSLLLTVRDVSTRRQLEASLAEVTAERESLRKALADLKNALSSAIGATMLAQQLLEKGGR
jgi:PAS domain-containing protein